MNNGNNATASDIADNVLEHAKKNNLIKKYLKINAEDIKLDSNSFDYILCKEAFHHFPRPYIGLYEMIRVSKKAVILIEPHDVGISYPPVVFLKNTLDKISLKLINRLWKNRFSFETVGNYVFKTSEREMEKIAMGINIPAAAFKGFVDYHIPKISDKKVTDIFALSKLKLKIYFKTLLCQMGFIPYPILISVIFKEKPDSTVKNLMRQFGFKYIEYPVNPYLQT